jgi:hypothetical protein
MATILKKNLVRETTEVVHDKEIIVTLTVDQEVELKLKGTRGSGETIGIKELYEQLYGSIEAQKRDGPISTSTVKSKKGDNKMISLYDLRTHNAISTLDVETLSKFDGIIKNLIDSHKKS